MRFATGVRPELTLARQARLDIGASGGVVVHEFLPTSAPAHLEGRIAASKAVAVPPPYGRAPGTSVVTIFETVAGMTGLSEAPRCVTGR